jgi:hypothetical protein
MPFPTRTRLTTLDDRVNLEMPEGKLAGQSGMVVRDDTDRMRPPP